MFYKTKTNQNTDKNKTNKQNITHSQQRKTKTNKNGERIKPCPTPLVAAMARAPPEGRADGATCVCNQHRWGVVTVMPGRQS